MSLYKQFKTDPNYESQGITLEYGNTPNGKPIRIKIARAGGSNAKFLKALEIKSKPYRRQLQNETIDPKIADDILMQVFVDSVILDWENVEDENGTALPFNRENCLKLFRDLPDLFADVREQASRSALFRAEIKESATKN